MHRCYAPPHAAQFAGLLAASFDQLHMFRLSLADRRLLLDSILAFYQFHVDNLGEIKSHEVLLTVLE